MEGHIKIVVDEIMERQKIPKYIVKEAKQKLPNVDAQKIKEYVYQSILPKPKKEKAKQIKHEIPITQQDTLILDFLSMSDEEVAYRLQKMSLEQTVDVIAAIKRDAYSKGYLAGKILSSRIELPVYPPKKQ